MPTDTQAAAAHRSWWDHDADRYHHEHEGYFDTFYWCPERLREDEAHLLGSPENLPGQRIVEIGAGSAPCSRWLAQQGAEAVALDISEGMLHRARQVPGHASSNLTLLQADALGLPLLDESADQAFSSFGAFPFIQDLGAALSEVHRVLRPGGRCVIATNHPMAWVFPDDPGQLGLLAAIPYFEHAYTETSPDGTLDYVEFHHSVGDWIRAHAQAGLVLEDVIEPSWPTGTPEWGQWSPLRGAIFPGTAIFVSRKKAKPPETK